MIARVAVASEDGEVINEHFGKASNFYIYDITFNKSIEFIESRETNLICKSKGHDDDKLLDLMKLIWDCRVVLASDVGPRVKKELFSNGIKAYGICGDINDSLEKLANKYNLIGVK